jgi:hypothetical protein
MEFAVFAYDLVGWENLDMWKRLKPVFSVLLGAFCLAGQPSRGEEKMLRLSVEDYRDKMAGSWVGQMVGVGWGVPTEFKYLGVMVPEEDMPEWKPETVNQFEEDDLYVEMTFLRTLEVHGLGVDIRQAGIDFANSGYPLWHANKHGRNNLRAGIAPPDSGHPKFNSHADDIDYQIEADFSGLISPGMPNRVIALAETFGRLMNYGDGVYGGQFVGGMMAESFFESDVPAIIQAGLKCVPEGSQYHECLSDVIAWHAAHPDDWTATWKLIDEKYQKNPDYRRASCGKEEFNIDAKINGAYVVVGLLYGEGDFVKTIEIATRCGQDSDCNPASAAGVLGAVMGYEGLSEEFKSALDREKKFSFTEYNFPGLLEVTEKLARESVLAAGGKIEKDDAGQEYFLIPDREAEPGQAVQSWSPEEPLGVRFTEAEMKKIVAE